MPYFICNDLLLRVLHNKTDFACLLNGRNLIQWIFTEKNDSGMCPVRGEDRFQMAQKGGFTAAASAAYGNIFALPDGEVDVLQCRGGSSRISKT